MRRRVLLAGLILFLTLVSALTPSGQGQKANTGVLDVNVPQISTDKAVKYDYDIVYVRAPRIPDKHTFFAEVLSPLRMMPGSDLMLLRPDGSEEVLVAGGKGAVMDPMVSFDGEWVFYSHIHTCLPDAHVQSIPPHGADIYKVHVKSKKIVKLTTQAFTPNTGAAQWSRPPQTREEEEKDYHRFFGVFNTGPCPLPGGKVVYTSNRNAFMPPRHHSPCLQLFVMNDDGTNVENIGHLNLGMALHPVVLKDGRIMFSSLESQGMRMESLWGLWSIHPDGTNWGPLMSAFNFGSAAQVTHFQTQLSDGDIVIAEYYQLNNWAFGSYYKFPVTVPDGVSAFGPGHPEDPRNPLIPFGRIDNGTPMMKSLPFSPYGLQALTPFVNADDRPAPLSNPNDPKSPRVGKFTHPSGAPDNHMLTAYSPGPVNHNGLHLPIVDSGIYLIKDGKTVNEPAQMRLIKNDPKYNEQWPRALVPYKRIYGVSEPKMIAPLANDGSQSKHLPEGTPYGLVGTSSLYKRETYPAGAVAKDTVDARFAPTRWGAREDYALGLIDNAPSLNWLWQGAEAGLYNSNDIHAIRILAMEPLTYRNENRRFKNFAQERLRILGEIPVRKFTGDKQPTDPDGNPDTSFLAKIPADMVWTFQTLDKDGMLLNMSQTWHQLRPGEIRNDCGGCHAHSQKPTLFKDTAAARPEYELFDLTLRTPLITGKSLDESGKKWDVKDETGLRYESGVKNVEYHRDVKPILERSCVPCHTKDTAKAPDGQWLLLDDNGPGKEGVPATYYNLVLDRDGKPKSANARSLYFPSRYVSQFQSRRSLLIWKIYGRRLDGFSNDHFPTPTKPGDPDTLYANGQHVPNTTQNRRAVDIDYHGSIMPPPEAVKGTYVGRDGKKVKVEALTDEDRRTLVRWVDLGCPIDLDYNPARPTQRGLGWMLDESRPTLTLTYPQPNENKELTRILIGMDDFYTGLEMSTFQVVADFPIEGVAAGRNLASMFKEKSQGVYELKLSKPLADLPKGKLTVSIRDRQGNVTRIDRLFSVKK